MPLQALKFSGMRHVTLQASFQEIPWLNCRWYDLTNSKLRKRLCIYKRQLKEGRRTHSTLTASKRPFFPAVIFGAFFRKIT